jgi:general secretion pathway protein G
MATTRGGFTLIEVLVVVGIILLLAGVLIPAVGLVQTRARVTETKQTLRELQTAFDLYRNEDARHSFPVVAADLSIGTALQDLLEDRRMWQRSQRKIDADGRLLDPWGGYYRYALARPAPATGSTELSAWNWDAVAGHERAWGARPDPADPLKRITGALPFAYLWSLGKGGRPEDAERWILCEDGR